MQSLSLWYSLPLTLKQCVYEYDEFGKYQNLQDALSRRSEEKRESYKKSKTLHRLGSRTQDIMSIDGNTIIDFTCGEKYNVLGLEEEDL